MGWRDQLLKNTRNYAKYLEKKERGPVKAFFHITKNENVPAIEQQGLLTNHPNANINSANHPFRKHGTDAGGVWVTTEPTAFPVYGTTIGGKNGNTAARADALSTIKIEVPLPELRKMKAVQDPYGKNILRKGDDPRAVEKFGTWAGIDVPTTVLLDDVKPQWLKNIGYVEENAPSYRLIDTDNELLNIKGGWGLDTDIPERMLNKADLRAASGLTGHRHNNPLDAAKSPYRFVDEYLEKNRPIADRLPKFPVAAHPNRLGRLQGATIRDNETNASKRFGNQPLAFDWSNEYHGYVKPGEDITKARNRKFNPGAISRGIGGRGLPPIKERAFDWDAYNRNIARGLTPAEAASDAFPEYALDWDNIVLYDKDGYGPRIVKPNNNVPHYGAISRGSNDAWLVDAHGEAILNGDEGLQQIKRIYENKKYRRDLRDALAEQQIIRDGKTTLKKNATWKDILRAWIDYRFNPNI